MKFGKRDKSIVDALFLLALFGVFLICALFIVLFGAKIYKNTVKASEDSFFTRTCYTYITEKIRQNDNANGVKIYGSMDSDIPDSVKPLLESEGSTVIELTKSIDDKNYITYLYINEGYLKEYTTTEGNKVNPAVGNQIIEMSSMRAEKCTRNLYKFSMFDKNGQMTSFYASVTSDISDASSRASSEAKNTENGGGKDE